MRRHFDTDGADGGIPHRRQVNAGNPINMYLNDVFTVSVNLAGLPGLSLPIGLSAAGLPLGLQVIGRAFDEATVFKIASALEADAKFVRK